MEFKPAQSLTEQIADHLESEIIFGRLAPCERIQELKIARSLGVSRGSVREALLILENRHLIDIVPRKGAVVRDVTRSQIEDLSDLTAELHASLFLRVAQLGDLHSKQRVLSCFDAAIHRMRESEQLPGDQAISAFVAARVALIEAAFEVNTNSYLEAVIRAILPAGQRLIFMTTQHPAFDLSASLIMGQTLQQAISANDVVQIKNLIGGHCRAEKALALDISIH